MTRKQKPRVCLVMICKDEAAIIEERLRAVLPEIDGWCIVDTGSRDETKGIVLNVLAHNESGLPGVLYERGWSGFAAARTEAVALAAKDFPGWWALLLDADTVFHAERGWRTILERPAAAAVDVDVISCEVHHGSIRYSHPRLVKLGAHEWRWRGVLHEYLEIPVAARPASTELIYVEHGSGGARSRDPERYRKDAITLRDARESGLEPDLAARYLFHEAQSWRDAGDPVRAMLAYEARAHSTGGFWEEVYISWLRLGEIRLEALEDPLGASEAWIRAWAVDPSRAEALIGLAQIHREQHLWAPAYCFAWQAVLRAEEGPRGMFADVNVQWRADFELGVAGWYTDHMHEGRRACERVLESDLAPEAFKVTARANLALYP